MSVQFQSSSNRLYSLHRASNLIDSDWPPVPGQINHPGSGGTDALTDTNTAPAHFYRVGVRAP